MAMALAGCTTATINCQPGRNITATANGPNYATILGQVAATMGPFVGVAAAAKAPSSTSTASADGTVKCTFLNIAGPSTCQCNDTPSSTSSSS
jgi:hypothetical protein